MSLNITISLTTLEKYLLTPDEYVYLYLLYSQNNKAKENNLNLKIDLKKLQKHKFIKVVSNKVYGRYYNLDKLFLNQEVPYTQEPLEITKQIEESRKKEKQEIEANIEKYWKALLEAYPKRYNGRVLHNKSVAYPKFLLALESDSIENILKGLKNELTARRNAEGQGKFFPAPKGLSAWLNQKVWKDYLDEDLSDDGIIQKVENL